MKTFGNLNRRQAGILMPVASLPSSHGIGDFGKSAYQFIDTIVQAGLKIWQILPLNPLGYGNSPYQPFSSFAGDELYISLDELVEEGLIQTVPSFQKNSAFIQYDQVREYKRRYLEEAFQNFQPNLDYQQFLDQAFWLRDFAEFMSLKRHNGNKLWLEWETHDVSANLKEQDYVKFIQYIFYKQWMKLKTYANQKGICIMGDMPIYVGLDSADVYYHRECFLLDKEGYPTSVAGVPPDYFSQDGQLWGNPLYDWDYLRNHDYAFWMERLAWNHEMFDVIRIDHFRAFDTYWKIPANETTAKNGEWILGPAYDFFDYIFAHQKDLVLVAEDLGDLRKEVLELKDHYHMLGMRIIQYSFGHQEEKENFKIPEFCIAYTGTHYNLPVNGWYQELAKGEKRRIRRIINTFRYKGHNIAKRVVYRALDCDAVIAIVPMQDFIHLGAHARINTPGTIGQPNWCWKMVSLQPFEKQIYNIRNLLTKAKRTD